MTEKKLTPCARWSDDVGGKQDYDGRIVSISTRYWPGRKSADGRPSATASVGLNHGEPDDYGFGNFLKIAEKEFSGDTESQVKVLVEQWVQEQFDRAVRALDREFGSLTTSREI